LNQALSAPKMLQSLIAVILSDAGLTSLHPPAPCACMHAYAEATDRTYYSLSGVFSSPCLQSKYLEIKELYYRKYCSCSMSSLTRSNYALMAPYLKTWLTLSLSLPWKKKVKVVLA